MKVYQTGDIRNIALVGGAKSGKTTLAECFLLEGGVINRRGAVEDKNTVSDYREIELERQNSVFSTVLYAEYSGKKINIIDTPGFDDFVGEVLAALTVSDLAVMLINAQNGIEVTTEISWRNLTRMNKPVMFVMNQLDHEKANFDEVLRELQSQFGNKVIAVQYPVATGVGFNAVVDVLTKKLYKYPANGGKPEVLDIPESEKAKADAMRTALIEAAAESDEALMEKFFENGDLSEEELVNGLAASIIQRNIFPLLCASSKHNMGTGRLMEFVAQFGPSPLQGVPMKSKSGKEYHYKSSDPFCAFVFKTSIEQHLGEISFLKIAAGEISEGSDVVNGLNSTKERITQIFAVAGKNREKLEKAVAGDIVATVKLKNTSTNETLNNPKNSDEEIVSIQYPEPKYRTAIKAQNASDDEKLGAVLNELKKIDPTILVEYSKELKQIIVSCQGEMHMNAAKWHMESLEKVMVELYAPKIPYRETITKPAKAMYRHKKQSGGAGQFGEVHMMVEPWREGMSWVTEFPVRGSDEHILPWGGKLVFNNCIVGGAIDARFMPAILKGIMEKIEEGPLTGSYARDIVVYVYDGKMHPVDSNELSFKLAGRQAFKEAFKNAGPKILEPIYDVEVMVPSDRMGDVMTDLQGRRSVVMGMDSEGNYQKIKARVPLAEMNRYSTALSSLTSGKATYTMKMAEYQQVPTDVQTILLKTYEDQEKDEE
ncbi:MAG: elongation factor G [Bacteroidetes bacterium GWF2_43_63]|nr:MAG: elongation factor G [Bacteroidetes bacterium GWE2_42_42]OFY56150.1 MAG: elongation factor G [Bacteroidetes bacterium GWF2_43_63]HBG69756.1 elongation factor G [Bacteroidales bacterium]HCB61132.1 elongation factor G [Bacteroidales bacterium]HCY24072.1 elongation factor G [Bacteroidales bacterium]